ncbi:SDR family NAD(P)-dependent oxidoreductase [Pseudomonas sp. NPDC089395]|uniref:SDR family NAD(P)-dependent oxidoreductase n=1 Tax=unclassified Pseudomonas TaxID=196821 RepID=UPI00300BD1F2
MNGKNIFLTGASRGIGAVLALELASSGNTVGCFSRKGMGPESVAIPNDLRDRLVFLKGDVTDPSSIAAALESFSAKVGSIHGLINNAGIQLEAPSARQALSEFSEVVQTNVIGTFSACQQAYPYLEGHGGLIINVGSFFDKMGVRRNAAYSASKAAIAAMGRCLAVEWAAKGIRVITVAPGYIETDLNKEFLQSEKVKNFLASRIPVGGPGKAKDVAALITMLFREQMDYFTGETIYLDGGQGVAL